MKTEGDKMLFVIDVGNTNIVFGIYEKNELLHNWRVATDKNRTADEYAMLFEQLLSFNKLSSDDIEDVIISSVVPNLINILPNMFKKYYNIDPVVIGPGVKTGMNIKYDNPKEVGADRIVNGVAGYEIYGGPLIVVDFGTAITFDAISEDGEYLGGAITPGVKISSEALFTRTAKLPRVEISKPKSIIGKNTVNSIQAGISFGYVGLVDYIIEKMIEELNPKKDKKVKVVATGGFAEFISKDSKYIEEVNQLLTLIGLRIIYSRNR